MYQKRWSYLSRHCPSLWLQIGFLHLFYFRSTLCKLFFMCRNNIFFLWKKNNWIRVISINICVYCGWDLTTTKQNAHYLIDLIKHIEIIHYLIFYHLIIFFFFIAFFFFITWAWIFFQLGFSFRNLFIFRTKEVFISENQQCTSEAKDRAIESG